SWAGSIQSRQARNAPEKRRRGFAAPGSGKRNSGNSVTGNSGSAKGAFCFAGSFTSTAGGKRGERGISERTRPTSGGREWHASGRSGTQQPGAGECIDVAVAERTGAKFSHRNRGTAFSSGCEILIANRTPTAWFGWHANIPGTHLRARDTPRTDLDGADP